MTHRETPEYADMLTRMVRAYGRRVADADPVDLARMVRLRAEVDAAIETAVHGLRGRHSWAEIAAPLGVTRQAAQMKWGKR
jgi:hypothetical protein